MEENAIVTQPTTVTFTPHVIDEDGWVTYTWIEEMLPSVLIGIFFGVGCAAFYMGLF